MDGVGEVLRWRVAGQGGEVLLLFLWFGEALLNEWFDVHRSFLLASKETEKYVRKDKFGSGSVIDECKLVKPNLLDVTPVNLIFFTR